jgi:MFS family permease
MLLLEVGACALALWQTSIGVRTDEAKYLLNIPYPHPPLLRGMLGMTDGLPLQDVAWRVLFASALVQAAWIVWDMSRDVPVSIRRAMVAAWLGSAALLINAGTVLLIVPAALSALVFLWLIDRPDRCRDAGFLGVAWLAALFSALQCVLLAPLCWEALRRRRVSPVLRTAIVAIPIVLLCLYAASNPLIPASILGVGNDAVHADWMTRIRSFGWVWFVGGGGLAAAIGTVGIFWSRHRPLILGFIAVCGYILVSHGHEYYALLLLPFFVAGIARVGMRLPEAWADALFPCILAVSIFAAVFVIHPQDSIVVPQVAAVLKDRNRTARVMIDGPFGHEWQYALGEGVRRFTSSGLPLSDAIVCTRPCPAMESWVGDWEKMRVEWVTVWVRR